MTEPLSAPSSPFADAEDPGATRLPRRVGFFVRHRARLGLLPGQVTTAALIQARRLRWSVAFVLPFAVVVVVIPFAAVDGETSEVGSRIEAVLGPGDYGEEGAPFQVVLADGTPMFFDRDPGVRAGQLVLVRQEDGLRNVGIVVDGIFEESTASQADAAAALFFVVFTLLFVVPLAAAMLPFAVWARRTHKQIRADLDAPTAVASGRYLGSWTWRGMTSRMWSNAPLLSQVSGFPIAIESRPGEVTWFGAPISELSAIRHFESAIASTDRQVVVTFHQQTHAVTRLESPDGTESVDLDNPMDVFHPDSGLSLKVSRRRRHAHLPDR